MEQQIFYFIFTQYFNITWNVFLTWWFFGAWLISRWYYHDVVYESGGIWGLFSHKKIRGNKNKVINFIGLTHHYFSNYFLIVWIIALPIIMRINGYTNWVDFTTL